MSLIFDEIVIYLMLARKSRLRATMDGDKNKLAFLLSITVYSIFLYKLCIVYFSKHNNIFSDSLFNFACFQFGSDFHPFYSSLSNQNQVLFYIVAFFFYMFLIRYLSWLLLCAAFKPYPWWRVYEMHA